MKLITKVLWFSRHEMSIEQLASLKRKLGEIELMQVNKTISSARELQSEIDECDVIAIVAPIGLQAEFIRLANGKPVISAVSDRIIVKSEDGSEDKVNFVFKCWEQLEKIEVVKSLFAD